MNIDVWKTTYTQNAENHNIMKNKIQECANLHNEPTNNNSYGSESQLARKPP